MCWFGSASDLDLVNNIILFNSCNTIWNLWEIRQLLIRLSNNKTLDRRNQISFHTLGHFFPPKPSKGSESLRTNQYAHGKGNIARMNHGDRKQILRSSNQSSRKEELPTNLIKHGEIIDVGCQWNVSFSFSFFLRILKVMIKNSKRNTLNQL